MGFYVSFIFLGIVLVVVTLILIVLDRKKSYDYIEGLNEKRSELSQIVNDAEQMIQELNRFSDYAVTRIDEKNKEMSSNLKDLDDRLSQLGSINSAYEIKSDAEPTGLISNADSKKKPGNPGNDLNSDDSSDNSDITSNQPEKVNQVKDEVKYPPLPQRHKEVLKLSESGLSDIEIAKKLNMGLGEIQLIIGLNK